MDYKNVNHELWENMRNIDKAYEIYSKYQKSGEWTEEGSRAKIQHMLDHDLDLRAGRSEALPLILF